MIKLHVYSLVVKELIVITAAMPSERNMRIVRACGVLVESCPDTPDWYYGRHIIDDLEAMGY
jgi:hypothetical protein